MNLSQIKLVVSDLDGTLLNSKHQVSSLFFELFKKLKAQGILFVAASGRPLYSMNEKLRDIKEDIIIVAENGGLAVKNNSVLLSSPIEAKHLSEIVKTIEGIKDMHPVFCTQRRAFVMTESQPLLNLLSEYYVQYQLIDTIDEINEEVYKVSLFHSVNSSKYAYPHVKHLESDFKVKLSAKHWVDISENIANKGHAIKLIQDMYNIKEEETMVFGDFNNDIEMLQKAYFSYAMKNANPEVKATARFQTESNDNHGVERVLQEMLSEKAKVLVK